jgi:hypothetical protein
MVLGLVAAAAAAAAAAARVGPCFGTEEVVDSAGAGAGGSEEERVIAVDVMAHGHGSAAVALTSMLVHSQKGVLQLWERLLLLLVVNGPGAAAAAEAVWRAVASKGMEEVCSEQLLLLHHAYAQHSA